MLQNRLIPCLLVKDDKLVKTVRFKNPQYIGDPVNAIKIFNEKEVDEIIVVDISDDRQNSGPNFQLIRQIANECFMPVCYGGGISSIEQIREILKIGIEKVALNSALLRNETLVSEAARIFGSQCVVVSVDVKKNWLGKYRVSFCSGTQTTDIGLQNYLRRIETLGAGEILLNNISNEGTWEGFDTELLRQVSSSVSIPVIAMGGAGNATHIKEAISLGKVSAVAIGSMAVYQSRGMGVLINFPKKEILDEINNL